jgi:GT2 family glycosyltransferase
MYLGHFLVVSRATIEQAGWFRGQCDGAECYDLALRISEASPKVHHVPQVLCHWRSDWTGSAADLSSTNHSIEAGRRSLEEAVKRKGWCARVVPGPIPATYSVQRKIESYPTLTVVICSRNGKLLERCLKSLKSTTVYPEWDVVVVWHMVSQDEPRLPAGLAAKVVPFAGQFNYSRMNNLGAAAAKGELLLFLNDDVEPILEDWMSCLAAQLIRENVGIVGACLLYPSGLIQHAGVVPGMLDGAGHPGRGLRPTGTDLWPWLLLPRNVSAVTGACMGVRKAVFERLGGMDTAFPNNYNDVDLCLRAAREGFLTIYEARAVLRHHECATRPPGTNFDERELFHSRWSEILESGDPYYSPSLRNDTELPAFRPLAAMQPRRP